MPGVVVTTATRSGPATSGLAPAATFFVAGLTERGRTDKAYLLRSMADYEAEFGARTSYSAVYDGLRTFFEEGGSRAYLVRVVGAAATAGTKTLNDRAGSPVPTLKLDAKGPGTWSTGVTVAIEAGTASGTFKVVLAYGGLAEWYDNLSTSAEAATAINSRSNWVTATDLGSVTVAPDNQPAVAAATPLSAGVDDRAAVIAADYVSALNAKATIDLGAGAVAVPGQAASAVGAGLIAHAVANRRLALLAPAFGTTVANAIAAAQSLRGTSGGEYAGVFYPWVQVPDGAGGVRNVPPEGFVAAARARAHEQEGPWRAPGGEISVARYVTGVETELTRTQGDQLDSAEVSAIRKIAGSVRLYGWRSLSSDETNYALLTGRDVLDYLVVEGEKRLEQYVFRTVDSRGHLFGEIAAEMTGLVEPLRVAGGLYELYDPETGDLVDPGYRVDTGPSINTVETLLRNEVWVAVFIRVAPTGALIRLLITKAGLTATL